MSAFHPETDLDAGYQPIRFHLLVAGPDAPCASIICANNSRLSQSPHSTPITGSAAETDGGRPYAVIRDAAPIVLLENNVVARTIHGMIALGGR